ncbi:MAG: chain-length determining protein [Paracoccaceae bacterium]
MTGFQSLGEVIAAAKRRFWVIVLIALAGCVLSVWIALSRPHAYEASAAVQIRGPVVSERSSDGEAGPSHVARELQLIKRRLMARDNMVRLVETFDLFSGDSDVGMLQRVGLMREAITLREMDNGAPDWSPLSQEPSGLIISVRLGDPEKAAEVANDLLGTVLAQSREGIELRTQATLDFFLDEEERLSREIVAQEERIAEFKRTHADALPETLPSLRSQMSDLREAELELERQLIGLEANGARQRQEVLDRQVTRLVDQRTLVAQRIAELEQALDEAPQVERDLSALDRQMTQLQEQFTVVTRRRAEAEMGATLEERQKSQRFEVLETALPSEYPVTSSRKKLALAGGVVSVFVALLAAYLLEAMNPAIRTAAQLERQLDIRPVVSIPTVRTRGARLRRALANLGGAVATVLGVPLLVKLGATVIPSLRPMAERLPDLPRP